MEGKVWENTRLRVGDTNEDKGSCEVTRHEVDMLEDPCERAGGIRHRVGVGTHLSARRASDQWELV